MKFLRKALIFLTYLLPAVLFFSYHPIIRLGENSSMNFELSLPLIWLVVFDLLALAALLLFGIRHHSSQKLPGLSDRKFFLLSLFPFYATVSILWSANSLRAILTAGIIWLIFIAVFVIVYFLPLLKLPANFRQNLLTSFFASSVAICLVCWLQSFLDIFGAERSDTLLCLGCTYHSFGFPHPSGFAIEPQFMGNLLLAPTLTALYLLIFDQQSPAKSSARIAHLHLTSKLFQRSTLIILAVLFSATLFLTFSRGAIYAYIIALLCLLIFAIRRHRHFIHLILIPIVTFCFVLIAQGIFCVIGPTNETFIGGISKSIHQLSLGIIDFRPRAQATTETSNTASSEASAEISTNSSPTPLDTPTNINSSETSPETTIFEGYVAESTNARLSLNAIALKTYTLTPLHVFFGVGLGGAGTAMHAAFPAQVGSPKEIVQNQPISLLLELGLVGISLIVLELTVIFLPIAFIRRFAKDSSPSFWRHPALPLLCSLIIAYLITLQFFSGLPNALHIYLLPPLLYLVLGSTLSASSGAKPLKINQNSKPKSPKTAKISQSQKKKLAKAV